MKINLTIYNYVQIYRGVTSICLDLNALQNTTILINNYSNIMQHSANHFHATNVVVMLCQHKMLACFVKLHWIQPFVYIISDYA